MYAHVKGIVFIVPQKKIITKIVLHLPLSLNIMFS
jgi:hypothetical protein